MVFPRTDAPLARLVEPGSSFDGLVSFRGRALIEGEFTGEVVAWGTLQIGESAVVRARIQVDDLFVAGRLEGDATARRRIELAPTARVRGLLRAPSLVLAEGCVVDGRCEAGGVERDPAAAQETEAEPSRDSRT